MKLALFIGVVMFAGWGHSASAMNKRVAVVEFDAVGEDLQPQREAKTRIRGELLGAGIEIVEARAASGESIRGALERIAIERGALGAVAMAHTAAGGPEIWVHDATVARTVVQRLAVRSDPVAYAPSILAVRAVEFLRANLVAMAVPATPPMPPPVVKAASLLPVSTSPAHPFTGFSFSAGSRILAGAEGLPVAFAPVFSVGWGGPGGVAIRASYVLPMNEAQVEGTTGSAKITQQILSGQVIARLFANGRFAAIGILESGALRVSVVGQSDTHDRYGLANHAWSYLVGGGLGVVVRATSWASLVTSGSVFAAVPTLIVSLDPDQPARLKTPVVHGEVALCIGF